MTETQLKVKINILTNEIENLVVQLKEIKAAKTFDCICGATHSIKNCDAIQTHYYIEPSGCTDGDYWTEDSLHIICPVTQQHNRLLFLSNFGVPYENREKYDYNVEKQFIHHYRYLFKSCINEYKSNYKNFDNNTYFDTNHEKFGLSIKT